MYVAPTHRGSGLGRRLLDAALTTASNWPDLEQITLTVTAGNEPALALYLSAGFTKYGREPRSLCIAGRYYDDILMSKNLKEARSRITP